MFRALTAHSLPLEMPGGLPEAAWKEHGFRHMMRDAVTFAGFVCDFVAILSVFAACAGFSSKSGAAPGPLGASGQFGWMQASLFGTLLLVAGFAAKGTYQRAVLLRPPTFRRKALQAWMLWSVLLVFYGKYGRLDFSISLSKEIILCLLAGAAVLLGRTLLDRLLAWEPIASRMRERVLFIGWTSEAGRLAETVWGNTREPYEIIGFVELPAGAHQVTPCANVPCLGDLADLVEIFERERISCALLTDVNVPAREIHQIANVCEMEYVDFSIIPSYFPILLSAMHVNHVGGTPVLSLDWLPLNRFKGRVLKRSMDVAGAVAGLILSSPIIALFGALVYLESPGSIFYRQKRIGRVGKPFHMIKIRSMRMDAEVNGRVGWTTKDDPRRLRIGTLMRKWNIDEIPQFWNVLRGDMSLVGPRPERPELISNFKHEIAHYNARHSIKPGVTGWAQVNGLRGDTDLSERIRFDIHYIEHWNLLTDLKIMVLTFFKHSNAC